MVGESHRKESAIRMGLLTKITFGSFTKTRVGVTVIEDMVLSCVRSPVSSFGLPGSWKPASEGKLGESLAARIHLRKSVLIILSKGDVQALFFPQGDSNRVSLLQKG